jgi:hypothetical protein
MIGSFITIWSGVFSNEINTESFPRFPVMDLIFLSIGLIIIGLACLAFFMGAIKPEPEAKIVLFKGETLFWLGLNILGSASLFLFIIIWAFIFNYIKYAPDYNFNSSYLPQYVGSIIFMLIGIYMMKLGIKKESNNNPKTN